MVNKNVSKDGIDPIIAIASNVFIGSEKSDEPTKKQSSPDNELTSETIRKSINN